MVDQDIFLRNGGTDASQKRVFCKLDSCTCAQLKLFHKSTVFRGKVDREFIVFCEIQSFFDFGAEVIFVFGSMGKIIQKFFYFRENFLF